MTPADVAGAVVERGATTMFGVPGGGPSLTLLDRFEAAGGDPIATHHEASAAIMAATLGRLTGRAGVAVSIKGPGLANLLPGMTLAALESWPLVTVSEAHPPGSIAMHKRTDHAAVTAGIVKWHGPCPDGATFATAADLAEREVPGPVALDLADPDPAQAGVSPPAGSATPHDPGSPGDVARRVQAADRPLVVAGTLALRLGLPSRLAALEVPVATTAAAKGLVDETAANAAGVVTGAGGPLAPETELLAAADLVVGIGLRDRELLGPSLGTSVVLVDDVPHVAGLDVAATCGTDGLDEVLDALAAHTWGLGVVASTREAMRERLVDGPFLPAQVYAAAAAVDHARLVVDTGDFCTIAEHVWQATDPGGYLGSGQGRYMGVAIPMGLAAALHDRRPTLVAVGDGGIGGTFGELSLAVERRLGVAVLFMRDGQMASVAGRARRDGLSTSTLQRTESRWREAAEGLGLASVRATRVEDVSAALSAWQPGEGPLFLECVFDPERYLAMTTDLR